MLFTLRWPSLGSVALLAVLTLSGQTDSLVIRAVTHQDHQPVTERDPGTPVPITRLNPKQCAECSFTYYSGIKERLRLVIRDQTAWREVWKTINGSKMPFPKLPEIDFSRDIAVIAGLGQKPTGGYGIVVNSAYEVDDQLRVEVVSRSPGRNCGVTAALTQPVDIVLLPRTDRSVTFRESDIMHDCK